MKRALLLGLCAGCGLGPQAVRQELVAVQRITSQVRKNGGMECAPAELALADSQTEFAYHDLEQGNIYEAQTELEIAQQNAARALEKSPPGKCKVKDDEENPTDTDGDGLENLADACPTEAEDPDKFRDEDGCPEFDNDNDNVRDSDDKCPNEPEDPDNDRDEDGCPEDEATPTPSAPASTPGEIRVLETTIEVGEPIRFRSGKATLLPASRPVLDRLAALLAEKPTLRVRVAAHTDSRGPDRRNLRLSRKRADAVVAYLVARGVDKKRLISEGYGETAPLADNRTEAGRERNRRVEFVIIGR